MIEEPVSLPIFHDGVGRRYVAAEDLALRLGVIVFDPFLRHTAIGPLHTQTFSRGLDGVPLVCNVPLQTVVARYSYVDAIGLVLDGCVPSSDRRAKIFDSWVTSIVGLPDDTFLGLKSAAARGCAVDPSFGLAELLMVLAPGYQRRLVPYVSSDQHRHCILDDVVDICIEVCALMALSLVMLLRARNGTLEGFGKPKAEDLGQSIGEAILRMAFSKPDMDRGWDPSRIIDEILSITIDGGQNAAVTAAEVAASADSRGGNPLVLQAIAVLVRAGDLHGGAGQYAFDQLVRMESMMKESGISLRDIVSRFVRECEREQRVIYGFGHRKLNATGQPDLRCDIVVDSIRRAVEQVQSGGARVPGAPIQNAERALTLLDLASELSRELAESDSPVRSKLRPNYDLYGGILLSLVPLEASFLPAFMFVGRAPGVMQHVRQFLGERGRILSPEMLIRPGSVSSI